jgi:hypothetical protein
MCPPKLLLRELLIVDWQLTFGWCHRLQARSFVATLLQDDREKAVLLHMT